MSETTTNTPATDDRYTVPALQRGLQLLTQFTREERELTGAELSRRLGLPRASVFRMLCTLEQGGFVERVSDSGSYKLGLAVLRLGFEYLASMELTEHGRPVIEELRDLCGYSAHLVVRDGREVVFIAKAGGHNAMFHSIQIGARLPAHATVLGRLLLANLDLAALRHLYPDTPLPVHTPRTPTTIEQLKALIDQHRADWLCRQPGRLRGRHLHHRRAGLQRPGRGGRRRQHHRAGAQGGRGRTRPAGRTGAAGGRPADRAHQPPAQPRRLAAQRARAPGCVTPEPPTTQDTGTRQTTSCHPHP